MERGGSARSNKCEVTYWVCDSVGRRPGSTEIEGANSGSVSTMEAEYIALSMCMRELIPLRRLLKELQGVFHFESCVTRTALTVFEDNTGALTLVNAPKLTPRSKHIAIPYHFFQEFIRKKEI